MAPELDLFLGTWDLVPEVSVYDDGVPPEEATYELTQDGAEVRVVMSWRPAGSSNHRATEFAGVADGVVHPVTGVAGVTGLSLTRSDARTLDSTALDGDTVVSSARRVASADGSLLVVVQRAHRTDGGSLQTVQLYRRRPGTARTPPDNA